MLGRLKEVDRLNIRTDLIYPVVQTQIVRLGHSI